MYCTIALEAVEVLYDTLHLLVPLSFPYCRALQAGGPLPSSADGQSLLQYWWMASPEVTLEAITSRACGSVATSYWGWDLGFQPPLAATEPTNNKSAKT
jgi:hypothetical protein